MNNQSKKTNIYFIRHGAVENINKIWYGRLPYFHLSNIGETEIEKVSKFLLNKHIDIIYSSPLLRAKQSAQIIRKKLGISKIHFSQNILEVDSSFQGSPLSYLSTIQYKVFAAYDNKVIGETIEQLSQRMQKFILQIVKQYKGENIVVVSHGDPIMIVKAKAENNPIVIQSIRTTTDDYIKTGGIYLLRI